MKKLIKKAGKIILNLEANSSVTYNMSKIEAVLFSKVCYQKLTKQISEIELRFGKIMLFFKKETNRCVGV